MKRTCGAHTQTLTRCVGGLYHPQAVSKRDQWTQKPKCLVRSIELAVPLTAPGVQLASTLDSDERPRDASSTSESDSDDEGGDLETRAQALRASGATLAAIRIANACLRLCE